MHIVLEWVEEAFKELESTPGDSLSNVPQVEVMDESSSDQVLMQFDCFFTPIRKDCFRDKSKFITDH